MERMRTLPHDDSGDGGAEEECLSNGQWLLNGGE